MPLTATLFGLWLLRGPLKPRSLTKSRWRKLSVLTILVSDSWSVEIPYSQPNADTIDKTFLPRPRRFWRPLRWPPSVKSGA